MRSHLLSSFRLYTLLFLVTASTVIYAVYQQVLYVKKQRRDFIQNNSDEEYEEKGPERSARFLSNKRIEFRNIYRVKQQIKWINLRQTIYNSHLGPLNNNTHIIVIQCHRNVYYLRQLLKSLSKAFFINKSFIIFSHDHYSYEMNKLVKTVNFAKYMQIFYPYSMQLHPNIFPGAEPKSCTKGFPCVKSTQRDPVAAQGKHHWWWQGNQIFNHLKVLRNLTQPILFLEDDNYVTEDVLVVFKLLQYAREIHCPFCELISMAAHDPELSQYKKRRSIVAIEVWSEKMPRTAIAIDKKTWIAIKAYTEVFCSFNDSNWDTCLKQVGTEKWEGNIYLTAIDGPRVFHLEKCDSKDVGCKMQYKVDEVQKFIKLISKHLYPISIKIKVMAGDDSNLTAAGYWNDPRDHDLCVHFAKQSVWY